MASKFRNIGTKSSDARVLPKRHNTAFCCYLFLNTISHYKQILTERTHPQAHSYICTASLMASASRQQRLWYSEHQITVTICLPCLSHTSNKPSNFMSKRYMYTMLSGRSPLLATIFTYQHQQKVNSKL